LHQTELNDNILMTMIGINFILNIILLNLAHPKITALVIIGYIFLGSGAILVIISTYTLKRNRIQAVIDTGIYSIVRHPMYLGGLIMFFSHVLLGQTWILGVNTLVAVCCCYLIILSGDKRNIKKFGDQYQQYMKSVPRINFILGIIRKRRD